MMRKQVNMLKDVIRTPLVLPLGYQKCVLTFNGDLICSDCCKKNYKVMLDATRKGRGNGWSVQDVIVLDHLELTVQCDECEEFLQ